MNIITADFNWISLLIIIVATVIGMIKSNSKKEKRRPIFPEPYMEGEENEIEEDYTNPVIITEQEIISKKEKFVPGDYYREPIQTEKQENSPIYQSDKEEKNEEYFQLDIRQAIISSEILRRPEF